MIQYTKSHLQYTFLNGRFKYQAIWKIANGIKFYSQKLKTNSQKSIFNVGQPTPSTHPHLLKPGELVPGTLLNEFVDRRDRLVSAILKEKPETNHIIIIPSATTLYMSEKIPYVFRQNTDFRYLTGCLEPDSVLMLIVNNGPSYKSALLVRENNKHSELWEGPRTGTELSPHMFAVDESQPITDFLKVLLAASSSLGKFTLWYDFINPVHGDINKILVQLLKTMKVKEIDNPNNHLHKLRVIKSKSEQALLSQAAKIASDAIVNTMQATHPGITEHQLFATVDYHCRMNGAEYLAYPPVVAAGNNANTIHYINNTQMVYNGEMILMDAGCELHGYCSDITRTWPANGQFTDAQVTLYEILLDIQLELISKCSEVLSLDDLFNHMWTVLIKKLKEGHILSKEVLGNEKKAAFDLCPHHVSHYLGMDVHDTPTIPRTIPLQEGHVITVEPGLYISNKSTITKPEFRGLGIRIEDDVLITSSGPTVLSTCPKQINEICAIMSKCHEQK